jgi:hypothetical protein
LTGIEVSGGGEMRLSQQYLPHMVRAEEAGKNCFVFAIEV